MDARTFHELCELRVLGKLGGDVAEVVHQLLQVVQREGEEGVERQARPAALRRLDVALEFEVVELVVGDAL